MSWYDRHVLPRVIEWAMHDRRIARYRKPVLAEASGRVLEIGFGTGANLPHYPAHIKQLEIVEPHTGINARAGRHLAASDIEILPHFLSAERLPFDQGSFDTVVSTCTLCSIPAVGTALEEMRRVLKPGGRFLFLEHGLSSEPAIARWQRCLTPLQKRIGGGCHLDRPIRELIETAGLAIESQKFEQRYAPRIPRVVGWLTSGVAKKI
ncbi:MAG: class I SAM-dependent methyltransferase [Gammaproteobacteria bacterium]|nr:class I SAM-dependent methyltransferase [Gammaproteobacteria bacterium]